MTIEQNISHKINISNYLRKLLIANNKLRITYKPFMDTNLKDDQTINKLREDRLKVLEEYLKENNNESKIPNYFYEIGFEKPGGIVMPIIVKYTYADGTTDLVRYPVQLWRKNIDQVYKVITSDKEIIEVKLDHYFVT